MALHADPQRLRRRLLAAMASPGPPAGRPEQEAHLLLLRHLRRGPVREALEATLRALPDDDAGLEAGFWVRAQARAAGMEVPFDADGLERWRSKV